MTLERELAAARKTKRRAGKPAPPRHPRVLPVGLRVLVVEDDPISAKLVAVVLAGEGCEVRTAASAEEAQQILAGFHPSVVVLDLVLPAMGGMLFAERLKADRATQSIVIVAVSAFNGHKTERAALAAGCALYLRKPIDPLTFPAQVLAALEGSR